MKTIETQVFTFDELGDKAKEKARDWFREGDSFIFDDAWEQVKDDAEAIGLKITALDDRHGNEGSFIDGAIDCAQAIAENHGPDCETLKTAASFLLSMDSLNIEYPEDAEGERISDYEDEKEELEKDFLQSILEDYRIMYDKEIEYRQSNEIVDANITANDYTFTADGKRFG